MNRKILAALFLIVSISCTIRSQEEAVRKFGFRYIEYQYKDDVVEVLIKSKKGEEQNRKPILLFIQGSGAKPLIKFDNKGNYFQTPLEGLVEDKYHLVYINKPGIPLIMHKDSLTNGQIKDKFNRTPLSYRERNYLEYYVDRNSRVLDSLLSFPWVDARKVVVAGHSEGSSIAAKLALKNNRITHLIYSGGTPYFSRILAMVSQDREKEEKHPEMVDMVFAYWEDVLKHPEALSKNKGWNTNKGTFSFSKSENLTLKRLTIPVLISYGTKDTARPFLDMFRLECMKENAQNIQFVSYKGKEHNYFGVLSNGSINYSDYNWDRVVKDWLCWLDK